MHIQLGVARLRDVKLCSISVNNIQSSVETKRTRFAPAETRCTSKQSIRVKVVVEGSSMGRISGSGTPEHLS